MNHFLRIVVILILTTTSSYSQIAMRTNLATPKSADSLDIAYYSSKKNGCRRLRPPSASIWVYGLSIVMYKKEILPISA